MLTVLVVLVFGMMCFSTATPTNSGIKDELDKVSLDDQLISNNELMFLLKLISPRKNVVSYADRPRKVINPIAHDGESRQEMEDIVGGIFKRNEKWNMDYGWGGGRYGKREAADSKISSKRYDMYGMSGRFGRDLEHVTALRNKNN